MYVYEYKRKKLTTIATTAVVLWGLDFALRVALYTVYGQAFYFSSGNRILAALSGVFAGVAITLWMIRSKSVKMNVPDEDEDDTPK